MAPQGRIIVENATDTVSLVGNMVIILNLEDDVQISAKDVLVYGSKMTYDCAIQLSRGGTIRFFENHSIIGLSDDAVIALDNGKRLYLRDIKSRRIRDLRGGLVDNPDAYGKGATMVGAGFTITYDMLDSLVKSEDGPGGWRGMFGRRRKPSS